MRAKTNSFFFSIPITGELIIEIIKKFGISIPDDAVLIKVVTAHTQSYTFEFIFHSKKKGWKTPEGGIITHWPRLK